MAEQQKVASTLQSIFTGIAALAALAVAVTVVHREFWGGGEGRQSPLEALAEPVADWDHLIATPNRIGAQNPKVVIVEFADFQCPACKRFHSSLKGVLAKYPNDVAMAFRQLPLEGIHPVAYQAARASQCAADQGRFAQMHDQLFEYQDSLGKVSLGSIAALAGVADSTKFALCLRAEGRVASIDADIQNAKDKNLRGTPSVIINGLLYSTVPDSARLERLVAYHLSRATEGK